MEILIVKLGATGDVVRTTELLRELAGKVTWLTQGKNTFGPLASKHSQVHQNYCKSSVVRTWGKILYSVESSAEKQEVRGPASGP